MNEPTFHMLIVEDDPDVGMGLKDFFELKGYDVNLANDGEKAVNMLGENGKYDIVLLDVMLPERRWYDVLRESQEMGVAAPVLMLTAKGEQEDVLRGFGLGVDDYVTKPFNAEELAARVKAILHRTQPPDKAPMEIYHIGNVEINFSTHEATNTDGAVAFTALEFDILRYLIQNRGRTVTRKQLLRDVWGIDRKSTRLNSSHVAI